MKKHPYRQRAAAMLLCLLMIFSMQISALAETAVPRAPVKPAVGDDFPEARELDASGNPVLQVYQNKIPFGGTVYLSWNEPQASDCNLWYTCNGSDFMWIASVSNSATYYAHTPSGYGVYSYCLGTMINGEFHQSNIVDVQVLPDDDKACADLRSKGLNNVWNLVFLVYRNASIGSYRRSFSDAQITMINRIASEMKYTMEGLSGGRMQIGTVDTLIIDKPITSASGDSGWGDPPVLIYGPGGDVDFNYLVDHKDITLAVVVAPLLGMNDGYAWLGLGGSYHTIGNKKLYTVIVNEIYTSGKRITVDGKNYLEDGLAFVHEILHAVETNSRTNGFADFQPLHNGDENGYETGTYSWYRVLMSNTLANGKYGFLKMSYYVKHYPVDAAKANGLQTDYDGVQRYYINGIPRSIDLMLPAATKVVSPQAFINTKAKSVFIPRSVLYIGDNAFPKGMTIYGYPYSAAEKWAKENNCTFISVQ